MLFEAAWQWLLERRVLLPGITTLTRLVASIRERAAERLWETLAGLLDSDQEARLDQILEVAAGARASTLECLRWEGPRRISGQQMRFALERVSEIARLGFVGFVRNTQFPSGGGYTTVIDTLAETGVGHYG